jgi:hypothetical protein
MKVRSPSDHPSDPKADAHWRSESNFIEGLGYVRAKPASVRASDAARTKDTDTDTDQ